MTASGKRPALSEEHGESDCDKETSDDSSDEGSEHSAVREEGELEVSKKRKQGEDTFAQGASSGGRKQRRM